MSDKVEMLHKLCEALSSELEDYSKKIEKSDGMSAGDLEAVDKLSHALKSIKTTIAMMESEDEGGYSGRYMPYWGGMTYAQGGNRGGGNANNRDGGSSYARGRGGNARRDSMGRYSRNDGYSYADGMDEVVEELRGMMDELPEEKRREVQRFVDKMERM